MTELNLGDLVELNAAGAEFWKDEDPTPATWGIGEVVDVNLMGNALVHWPNVPSEAQALPTLFGLPAGWPMRKEHVTLLVKADAL